MGRRLPIALGQRIRRARLAARCRQRDVAQGVGISQSTISRLELGKGASISLDVWMRVAREVGLDLRAHIDVPVDEAAFAKQLRCHRSVVELASTGGWFGWTLVNTEDPSTTATILERRDRQEVAVVHVWDVIGDVDDAIVALRRQVRSEQQRHAGHARVGGFVVVVQTGTNRRRLIESAEAVLTGLEIYGDAWWTALRNVHVAMPIGLGTIWTDPGVGRLRPRIPHVDGRPRHG